MLISIGKLGALWARVSSCNRKLGGHARMSGFLNEGWRVSVVLNGDKKRLTPLLRTVLINTQAEKRNTTEAAMSNSIAGSKQKRDDLEVVIKYVKNDLFAKVKFIYDAKVDLAVGGKIYSDYQRKCKNLIGGRGLTAESHDTYMEAVWTAAMTKHVQKISLVQKRSAVYTVMQNKFSGMLAVAAVLTGVIACHS
jgi:hypothetical protein